MSLEKTDAIVLKLVEFSETSLVVTMYTSDFGRVTALAKGARRPKSPFESALDLLSLSRIVCLHKNTEALDLLTEAKLVRRFRSCQRDLLRLYAGYYLADFLLALTEESDPNRALYDLTEQTLEAIDHDQEVNQQILRFELTALRHLGHLPELKECVQCTKAVDPATRAAFGLEAGGVLCSDCRKGKRKIISVSVETMQQIRIFAEQDNDNWRNTDPAVSANLELRQIMNHYIALQMGRRPRMAGYLEILGKAN
jgi:DNA repair protein RecO (recombination protein O)